MVLRAAELLGCDRVVIVNLLAVPATDVPAMSVVGLHRRRGQALVPPWRRRSRTRTSCWRPGDVIPVGCRSSTRPEQLQWLHGTAAVAGHHGAWAVGGRRGTRRGWNQYLSDRHGRMSGRPPLERLGEVLGPIPLSRLVVQRPRPLPEEAR